MANIRQYIGARYVIKIYENSQDSSSAEWEQGNFEPLVLVTWQNGSYLSKKEVPASVGNPALNPTYWVQTGFYNGQIASLQAQIDAINNTTIPNIETAIEDLETLTSEPKILFIGDSYNTIWSGQGWDRVCANLLGGDTTRHYYLSGGGRSFTRVGYTFISMLQNDIDNINDKDKFTDIILCAGANDEADETLATLQSAMSDFKEYCETQFPNAKLHIGFIGWSGLLTKKSLMITRCQNYINACQNLGIRYLHNVQYVLHNYSLLYDNTATNPTDYHHPTVAGNEKLGEAITQAFLTGECTIHYEENISITPSGATNSIKSGNTLGIYLHNGQEFIDFENYYSLEDLTCVRGDTIDLGNIESDIFRRANACGLGMVVFTDGSCDTCFLQLTNDGTANAPTHITINWRGVARTSAGGGGLILPTCVVLDTMRN